MNYIATWLYADKQGEESNYCQTGANSSEKEFHDVYWRCVCTFFAISKKQHPGHGIEHVLFTNLSTDEKVIVDGLDVFAYLQTLDVRIWTVPFTTQMPQGYYHSWNNQFYEFSILKAIAQNYRPGDCWMLMDSDCVFINWGNHIFSRLYEAGCLTYSIPYPEDYDINGLTRAQMRELYQELTPHSCAPEEYPTYFCGDILACTSEVIKDIVNEWEILYPILIARHKAGKTKFNEEAHCLSYIYHKLNYRYSDGFLKLFFRRIWTQPSFRNIYGDELKLHIWHCPAEKRYGFKAIFDDLILAGNIANHTTETLPEYLQTALSIKL